jgi:hypothetical protein
MKIIDNIFASIYLFFDAINEGGLGHEFSPIIGSIFVLCLSLTVNILSFFPEGTIIKLWGLYYVIIIIVCCILIFLFYRKKRYIKVISCFRNEKNKNIYYVITIIYIIVTISAFAISND